ncbi:hypothetical protein SUGI_0207000 [Cryptomeria japonica]|nr:hypothetical protein SUGI_0207000 [Cryptomeria japonica]
MSPSPLHLPHTGPTFVLLCSFLIFVMNAFHGEFSNLKQVNSSPCDIQNTLPIWLVNEESECAIEKGHLN